MEKKGWNPKDEWNGNPRSRSGILIRLNSPDARPPCRATPGSAGYDLCSSEKKIIGVGERGLVDTGFSMAFPPSMYARIAPRSGLSVKHRIDVGAGVIDSDYRGPVKVLLINNGSTPFEISPGDRIAQMIFERIELPEIQITAGLPESEMRGEGGFGSTGK